MAGLLPEEDLLLRMQRDLRRAIDRNLQDVKWTMVIDVAKCVGCHACTVACIAENKLPPGVVYRPVIEEEIGEYPHVRRKFTPRPCLQCQNPPCVKVCPVTATYKNSQGVTIMDYDRCIGCRYCLVACPYAARTADFGDLYTDKTAKTNGAIMGRKAAALAYEITPAPEYNRKWPKRGKGSPVGNARKCHFCLQRLDKGMLPACVTSCIGRATFFGDSNDKDSLVYELLGSPRRYTLKEELGTRPNVFYLA